MVTKRGSAVLLVISQALSLPVTNIAFTLKIFMGDHAEPLTGLDLAGLVLVCIGFLTYSGYGFATNFMVAQSLQLKEKQKQKQKVGGGGCVGSGFGMGVGTG
ncbi:hypothetical protein B484DRAFT_410384 [Ochromonadaceae sp. CCMP2298]|nr:hypothetical protein B484DRAFT_410384 [Ochromonadaceae sp. CCMP2298]